MGNWHCVSSGCAQVVYREYLGAKVRWRYDNEPWQEILGADSYTTVKESSLNQNTSYQFVYRTPFIRNGFFQYWNSNESASSIGTYNGVSNWQLRFVLNNGATILTNPFCTFNPGDPGIANRQVQIYLDVTSQGITTSRFIGTSFGMWGLRVEQTNAALRSEICKFKVFKQGIEVYSQVRATCPEVEVIPCSLSQTKNIHIKKWAYLNRVEVVDYAYDVQLGLLTDIGDYGLLLTKKPIPAECLNVYNNDITSTIPTDFGQVANTPENGYRLIQQICSVPGCPPPAYEVICNDCCEKCPDYTCPIECGDNICCYNDYGVSVQTIPKSIYCEGVL